MPAKYPLMRSLVKDEQLQVEANVVGEIPSWVDGTLYRNGPARFEYGDKEYTHWFDGHGCIHKFRVENGKVTYSNKFVESDHFKKVNAEKRLYPVFGTSDVCSSIYGRFQTFYTGKGDKMDNTNVNIVPYGNEHLYALTETNMVCKLDPANLKVQKIVNVTKYIPEATTTIAHPHVEEDGGWIIMGMNTKGKVPHYNFLRFKGGQQAIDSTALCEKGELIAKVPTSHSMGLSYFHSFGLSKNYIIYIENALVFDFKSYMIGVITNRSFADNLVMHDQWNSRIHVINRHTGEILKQKLITDPLFIFHHANAFEQYDADNNLTEIIVDVCAYDPKTFNIKKLSYKEMFVDQNTLGGAASRIVIPMTEVNKAQKEATDGVEAPAIYCKVHNLNPKLQYEFPIINYEKNNGLPYKYFYGTNIFKRPFSIIKQATESPYEMLEWKCHGGEDDKREYLPSEPSFVANPNATSEDDGVLLVMVLAEDNDFLAVLDARDLKELARATLPEDAKGATTFHGFFADKAHYPKLVV